MLKSSMRFLSTDFIVASTGAVIISVFSALYYVDVTSKVQSGSSEVIGNITYKKKVAQRKYTSQVVWEDVEQNSPLYNNDSIRTAEESEAVLRLNDGTEIAVAESSMILLTLGKNTIDISFSQGALSTNRTQLSGRLKQLNVKSGATNVVMDKGSMRLAQAQGKELSLSVSEGKAGIETAAGKQDVGKNQMALIGGEKNEVNVYKLNLNLLSPAPDKYFLAANDKKEIDFYWEAVEGKPEVILEISGSTAFNNIISRQTKADKTETALNPGTYYWRIHTINNKSKKTEYSETRKFTIVQDEPVNLFSPQDKETITYKNSLPIINFKWSKSRPSSGYKLILSKDKNFKDILQSADVADNAIMIDTLGSGTYFWRVDKAVDFTEEKYPSQSATSTFTIAEKKAAAKPELIYPPDKKKFGIKFFDSSSITFTWKTSNEYKETKVIIAKDNEFKKEVYTKSTTSNFVKAERLKLKQGEYFWRVDAVFDDKEMAVSDIRKLIITDSSNINLMSPGKTAVMSKDSSLDFAWEKNGSKGKYRLVVSKDEKLSNIYKEKYVDSSIGRTTLSGFTQGEYFWKIILLDEENNLIADSTTQQTEVKGILRAPEILSPLNKQVINMEKVNVLEFNWKKVEGATLYKVIFYREKNKELISEKTTSKDSLIVSDLKRLDTGKFYWTIQSLDVDNKLNIIRESEVLTNRFEITLGKRLEKAKIKTPSVIYVE